MVQAPVTQGHAKFTVYEGGVHVPLVVAGRGVTREHQREDALINGVDVFATIAQLAGASDPVIHDGESFKGALTELDFQGRDHIYTEYRDIDRGASWAVRDRRYKLIKSAGAKELYDLDADPWEHTDLMSTPQAQALQAAVSDLED